MLLQNLKGTNAYYGNTMMTRRQLIDKLVRIYELFGFSETQTPIINSMDLLSWKYGGGAEILKEVYQLTDQGGRSIGLRYDLTIPFAKLIALNQEIKLPFKRYEIGTVFRDGPTKLGRKREFIQADVDIVGSNSIYAELDFFFMIQQVFSDLNLPINVEYNDRNIILGLIELSKIPSSLANSIILTLDKIKKLPVETLIVELIDKGLSQSQSTTLLNYVNTDTKNIIPLLKENITDQGLLEKIIEFESLQHLITQFKLDDMMTFTPSLARGLDVYTGCIWEVFSTNSKLTSSIAAGGRYDNLIGSLVNSARAKDKSFTCVGMTFGVDVILEVLTPAKEISPIDIFIIPMASVKKEAQLLTNALRKLGFKSAQDLNIRNIKKALNYANQSKIPFVIILGENEIINQTFMLKNMKTGEVTSLNFTENYSFDEDVQKIIKKLMLLTKV